MDDWFLWIGDYFDNCIFDSPGGSIWKVGGKVSAKEFLDEEAEERDDGITLVESQAIYHCRQVEGPSVGQEAIMKIRVQCAPWFNISKLRPAHCLVGNVTVLCSLEIRL